MCSSDLYYPGSPMPLADPDEIDFVVVREGTEGLYCGNGGVVRAGTPHEIATEVSVNTAYGVERVVRYAFERARARRGRLTLVHKHNVLVNAGHLWRRTVEAVGARATPTSSSTTTMSTPPPSTWSPTRAASTSSSPTTSSATSSPTRPAPSPAHLFP